MIASLVFLASLALVDEPMILWDGDQHVIGEGWVGGQCKTATIKKEDKMIRFHTMDPKTFGADIRPFKSIALEIRTYGSKLPNDLLLSLRSPGDHHLTVNDSLIKREPTLLDHKWHRIVVPMKDLKARDEKFDPMHVVNVILGVWVELGDFTVDLRKVELLP